MQEISQRFFRLDPGATEMLPVDLCVSDIKSFIHEGRLVHEVKVSLPGIVPGTHELSHHNSSLQALIAGLETVRVFFGEFEKAGGKLYPCRFDSVDQPWTGDGAIKGKSFLRIR